MPPEKTNFPSFKLIIIVLIIAAALVAGYFLTTSQGGLTSGAVTNVVALVNKQQISRAEYDGRYAQLASSIVAQGQSATSTEMQEKIKTQTLDNLITETLLLQTADKKGIKATEEQVNTAFTQNKAQFPDEAAFQKELVAQGLTETTFREFLTKNIAIRQYLTASVDLSSATTTKAEVKAFYDQAAAQNKNVPPLAQVRTQVENQIVQQKQQELVANFIKQLRASSTVEILLK